MWAVRKLHQQSEFLWWLLVVLVAVALVTVMLVREARGFGRGTCCDLAALGPPDLSSSVL